MKTLPILLYVLFAISFPALACWFKAWNYGVYETYELITWAVMGGSSGSIIVLVGMSLFAFEFRLKEVKADELSVIRDGRGK